MHEHVSVSHEKDFTGLTDLMNYRFYSFKVDSNVKKQVLTVLYKQKKPLLLQVWKFSYVRLRYLILNNICALRVLQTSISSFSRLANLSFLAHFIIKIGVLGVPRGNQILPHEGFCIFFITEMFLKLAFFLVTSVQEKFWLHIWSNTMIGWQRILLGFRPSRTFTLSMTSYSQISLF